MWIIKVDNTAYRTAYNILLSLKDTVYSFVALQLVFLEYPITIGQVSWRMSQKDAVLRGKIKFFLRYY